MHLLYMVPIIHLAVFNQNIDEFIATSSVFWYITIQGVKEKQKYK